MPKRIAPLTDVQVRTAKPQAKELKLFDGGGLFLQVTPSGGKLWQLKYRFDGKELKLALGAYPAVTLQDARQRREDAKKLLANDVDPGAIKKAQKATRGEASANTFEVVAREWHEKTKDGKAESYARVIISRLERDIFPWMGARPIVEIKPPEVLKVLQRMEERGAIETARRMKIVVGQILRYAVATGRAERDFTPDLKGALKTPLTTNMASITDPKEVGALLRSIHDYSGSFVVKCALQLAPLFFLRPGELRCTEWAEIDFEKAELNIPVERMKLTLQAKRQRKGETHIVPLSRQAIAILKELQPLTGHSKYVFPSHRTNARAMSNNAVLSALRRMGYPKEEMSGHGFRAMARTILDEVLQVRPDFIEHQLAHAVRDPNGRAYNRTAHLDERRKMMQLWADYLDALRVGAKVVPFQRDAKRS